MSSTELLKEVLTPYKFIAKRYIENDKSITLSLDNIDLIENAPTEEEAKIKLAEEIKEYSEEFYNDIEFWGSAPNRRAHIPFVLKAIISNDINEIVGLIECQDGEN